MYVQKTKTVVMGCVVTTLPKSDGEMNVYKRQTSLTDLERLLRTTIDEGVDGKNSSSCDEGAERTEHERNSAGERLQVYGRICTTKDAETPPVNLSDVPGRKTAFLFGPDTVYGALIENIHDAYTMLLKLGFLPEYIHLKACKQRACYWIVLLSPSQVAIHSTTPSLSSVPSPSSGLVQPVPATWDGLLSFLGSCYPDSLPAVRAHWSLITTKPVDFFEEKSPVRFIEALRDPRGPDFMSYEKFRALPKPQRDWETRLFLYCELRIFELFSGDGYTWSEAGVRGEKEYMSPNYFFETDLGPEKCIVIPLKVTVPPDVKAKFDEP